jgi:CheY-like chemotaxis protein
MANIDKSPRHPFHSLLGVDQPQNTLLYIEDNATNLALVEQIIARRCDMKLLCAKNGPLGVQMARQHLPDTILMDIKLPGISGIDTFEILRSDATTAHIPVIAVSSDAFPRDIEKAVKAGFFHYLTKPFKVKELMDTIDASFKYTRNKRNC